MPKQRDPFGSLSTDMSLRLGLALVSLTLADLCLADERILDFHSEVSIVADGRMQVAERIRVRTEGTEIRRGIFRDFPTEYRDRLGNRYGVTFDVQSVRRDDAPEPYFEESRGNGVRVYVGSADRLLDPGEYTYEIRYTTDRQIGFFESHDELYWNVTGNGWAFPIDRASARVELPAPVSPDMLTIEGYTGPQGSTERAYRASVVAPGIVEIETTRTLAPQEGLTLVSTWPKAVIAAPTRADAAARLLSDNLGLLIASAWFLITLGYYVAAWNRLGRDPARGVIFPHYEPPPGISPASARHVSRMGYDSKTFTAAVINLAVKRHLEIDESDGEYTLRAREGGVKSLAPGEATVLAALFAGDDRVVLENKNHRTMQRALSAHRKSLQRDNYRRYFVTNSIYTVPAAAMLVIAVAAIALFADFTPAVVAVIVATVVLTPLFAWLLKAPTAIGRRLLDKLEGFKLYLEVAEQEELELKNPPEKTPELFEAYLPYALALGVEQRWSEKFDRVFARLREDTGRDYVPVWYHGHWGGRDVGSMTAKLAGTVGTAIASASTPPGSSSGAGGGGSSGGGGGGGGGGGW